MEIQIDQEVIDTVCNSLRASKQSLITQLAKANTDQRRTDIISSQLNDVVEALRVSEQVHTTAFRDTSGRFRSFRERDQRSFRR